MKEKELEIALNHDNIMTFSDCINTRIAYETVYQEKDKEIEKLKEREKMLQESFSDWKKGIEKERKYWLCERTDCCGRIKDSKKYSSLYQENKRLNNIINELERYINEEYIYDELGMKIFDASKLQDKLQELKGSDKE